MDNQNQEQKIDLMSFDLGESNGGRQLILTHKSVSPTEHYVFTIGDGPQEKKAEEVSDASKQEPAAPKKLFSKQTFLNIRNHLIHKKPEEKKEENNVKLRCFKLSLAENGKYLVKEFKDPVEVEEVAKMFDI